MDKGLILTAGVFIALNLAWIWRMTENKKEYQQQIRENKDWIRKQDRDLHRDQEVLAGLLESDDFHLNKDLSFLTEEGTSVTLADILIGHPRLVLYLADDHCDSCVEQIVFSIKKIAPEIGISNLVVFYSSPDLSSSKWKKFIAILPEIRFYRIFMGNLNMPVIKSGVPFLFISDSTLKAQTPMLIFPETEEEVTASYINLKYLKLIHQNQPK
ncbi:MAG: hypothetical protein V2A67_03245 [Bacteroidota bacterium]